MQTSSSTSKIPAIAPLQMMRGHTEQVRGIVHLPGGRRIITCSLDGSLRMWDLESGMQIGENWWDEDNIVRSMALSPNGRTITSGSSDGKVRLWDVNTKTVISKWTGHSNVVCALCWSADGERVVSGSWDGTARVWDVDNGKTVLTIKTRNKGVYAVMYSPDTSKLAIGGGNAAEIWDAKTGELLNTLKHNGWVCSLAWTSDGKKLISGSYRLIRIFDTATWQLIAILEGHKDHVINAISLSPNNRLLASASLDSTARLWNLDTNLPVGPPLQHQKDLRSAALSLDAKVLVTACQDKNAYTWDIHSILRDAGLEDLLAIDANLALKDARKQKAPQDNSGIQHTPRSSSSDRSSLEADATQYPGQFGGVDELSTAFFQGMEADVDSFPISGAHPHSFVNALLARLSLLLHRFLSDNGDMTEHPQPSRPSVFHLHALFARLSSFMRRSPPENDAPDGLQPPSMPSRLDPHVLLARISSLLHRSRLNTDEGAEPHPPMPSSSRPDAPFKWLSSLFRAQLHSDEEIALSQRPSHIRVIEVAAVRDKQALIVARGPKYEKARRAYEQQAQSHAQAQASSSHTRPVDASTSATHPAPGTAAAQPLPISWWAQIVLFLCCTSPPHANGRQYN